MTSKTFVDHQEETRATVTTGIVTTGVATIAQGTAAQGTSLTWQNLAGHWLRPHTDLDHEPERLARRQAAVQRWRGLIPENTARL